MRVAPHPTPCVLIRRGSWDPETQMCRGKTPREDGEADVGAIMADKPRMLRIADAASSWKRQKDSSLELSGEHSLLHLILDF